MSSSRVEILNDGGLRSDFRRPHELRTFSLSIPTSSSSSADGIATCSHGLTTVIATVHGPREAKMRSATLFDRAVLNIEVGVGSWAGNERRRRGRGDKRIQEIAAALESTFEPVIQTQLYPRSEINIYVQVLSMDGALLQTAINATTLALLTSGISLLDSLLSLTIGIHLTTPLLDLTSQEESDLPHVVLAFLPRSGKVTTAELNGRLDTERFAECLRVAGEGVGVLRKEMEGALRDWADRVGNEAIDLGGVGATAANVGEEDDMDI
ncbi:Exosomal 3'-5' exoribonuclease complex, subunit Rrp41 and related exoribonucleases [Phaffia rhodozyma]|uniref:Ribosomal RNA-processing protein 41 n=1 Tax=Phaffia rhodozyma TaxID=264483 RepID=A0A0F7SP05_PHARH|nr:Exosomal 3'-5' exoribonuclease complex, subunit Rrp41 and related exoribonucleases [Phaffia rhodozyma]